jgi:hypothetical protein
VTEYASINGIARIIRGRITIPYYGLAVADVELASTFAIPDQCQVTIADMTLAMNVYRTDSFAGITAARLVAGFSGWLSTLPRWEYRSPPGSAVPILASTVIRDVAEHVGERVNIDPSVGTVSLGSYFCRDQGFASNVLRELTGSLWWVDANGVTQCGVMRAGGAVTSSFLIEDYEPARGTITASTEHPGDWVPGRTITNTVLTSTKTLSLVEHIIDNEGTLRTFALAA